MSALSSRPQCSPFQGDLSRVCAQDHQCSPFQGELSRVCAQDRQCSPFQGELSRVCAQDRQCSPFQGELSRVCAQDHQCSPFQGELSRVCAQDHQCSPFQGELSRACATEGVNTSDAYLQVRGRFAPSPSGFLHLGNLFSALCAWGSARRQGGEFMLRLEDLDPRCKREYADQLIDDLRWLGIDWDEEPVLQSEFDPSAYEEAFEALKALLYPCFCSRADLHSASAPHASDGTYLYAGTCAHLTPEEQVERAEAQRAVTGHGPAWRVRVPNERFSFTDAACGYVEQNLAEEVGDFVVRRGDGVFAYQLAVVIDDARAGVTEVVRGNDLLMSTPRQLYLQQLLGLPHPSYAHHPILVAEDGRRLSKREADLGVAALRASGVKPERIIGFLAHVSGLVDSPGPMTAGEFAVLLDWSAMPKAIEIPPCKDFLLC